MNAFPEVLSWKLRQVDQYIILASDGVFEFLDSQIVVDTIKRMEQNQHPFDATKHIITEAYRLWLTHDERTDDITLIVIQIADMNPMAENHETEASLENSNTVTNTNSFAACHVNSNTKAVNIDGIDVSCDTFGPNHVETPTCIRLQAKLTSDKVEDIRLLWNIDGFNQKKKAYDFDGKTITKVSSACRLKDTFIHLICSVCKLHAKNQLYLL